MCDCDYFMTQEILEAFTEEISARQGKVTETFHQTGQLFVRAVLPQTEEIRARDNIQSGVALRATDTAAWVYPYVFRLVCKNGAIMARASEGREIPNLESLPTFEVVSLVREAVESCCEKNAFATAAEQVRTAAQQPIDAILSMMPFLSRVSSLSPELASAIRPPGRLRFPTWSRARRKVPAVTTTAGDRNSTPRSVLTPLTFPDSTSTSVAPACLTCRFAVRSRIALIRN